MSSDDDIRKQFQEKFNDFKAEVPADGWDRLEDALNAAPVIPMPRRRWRYAISAVAAVLLLIIGSLLLVQQPWDQSAPLLTESSDLTESATQTTTPVPSTLEMEPERIAGGSEQLEVTSKQHGITKTGGQPLLVTESRVRPEKYAIRTMPSSGITTVRTHHERVEQAVAAMDARALNSEITSLERRNQPELPAMAATNHEGLPAGFSRSKERKPILLAVAGRGGLTSYQQTVNTPMTLRAASDAVNQPEEETKNIFVPQNTADNVSEMEHDQPISIGITVSKEIVEHLYIETGLVYSYLYSKVRNASANYEEKENQRLHYIGVPVNVNYNVISLNKLNVYASVGGMIEKDVHGDFRGIGEGEAMTNSRSERMEVRPISQRNPQISVNAGVGISYPVYNRLRLYGKIGGSYYFDANNEYKTIYSDRKIVMDLNVGIRC